ncbi:MAG: sulfotransferase family protein, partial [Aestuariivirgaceae bacterium]
YYMDSLPKRAGDTRLFVDKSMSTYGFVGSILRLFPNARFVQCVRHPMEAAWSMYSTLFQTGQLQFTTDFAGLAQKYEIYENFMTLWDRLYPDRILHLYYDELINDPEVEIRRILNHLGLEWDPACLDFHTTKNTVRTASITQVRQPLYKTASQKWRSYEAHLEPLQTLLAPFIDRYQRRCFARAKTDTA